MVFNSPCTVFTSVSTSGGQVATLSGIQRNKTVRPSWQEHYQNSLVWGPMPANDSLVCNAWKWFVCFWAFFDWWPEAIWNPGLFTLVDRRSVPGFTHRETSGISASWSGTGRCAAFSNNHLLYARGQPQLRSLGHIPGCLHSLLCPCLHVCNPDCVPPAFMVPVLEEQSFVSLAAATDLDPEQPVRGGWALT